MTINQHNYEEFFLLYADGELSAADKQAVEQFVQGNPGLADELEMFMQMRLPDEPMVFAGKELLYKNGSTGISLDNYEENFLLYVDNELDTGAKEQVETFVLQHPALQEGFTLLKQTRLEPELVVCPDKESLYRQEQKKRPVFYIGWQRVAVAAAFTGLAILLWTVIPGNKNTTQKNIAQQTPAGKAGNTTEQQLPPPVTEQKKSNVENKADENTGTRNIAAATAGKSPALINTNNKLLKSSAADNAKTPDLLAGTQEVTLPAVSLPKADPVTDRRIELAKLDRPTQELPVDEGPRVGSPKPPDEPVTAALIKPAVYKELDTDDDKKTLYLGSLEINKDKLRGFFRKAGSIFRSKARQQEEERSETGPSNSNTRSLK